MPARRSPRAQLALAIAFLAATASLCATAAGAPATSGRESPGTWCGGSLWRLMTLSDNDRTKVNLHGTPTTIADIAKLVAPQHIVAGRTTAFQRRVWKLHAVIDRYRIASNGELVLILFSIPTGQYMDVYLPNPRCLGERARDRTGDDCGAASVHVALRRRDVGVATPRHHCRRCGSRFLESEQENTRCIAERCGIAAPHEPARGVRVRGRLTSDGHGRHGHAAQVGRAANS